MCYLPVLIISRINPQNAIHFDIRVFLLQDTDHMLHFHLFSSPHLVIDLEKEKQVTNYTFKSKFQM